MKKDKEEVRLAKWSLLLIFARDSRQERKKSCLLLHCKKAHNTHCGKIKKCMRKNDLIQVSDFN